MKRHAKNSWTTCRVNVGADESSVFKALMELSQRCKASKGRREKRPQFIQKYEGQAIDMGQCIADPTFTAMAIQVRLELVEKM